MSTFKAYKKFKCYDDEGEPLLLLEFGLIRSLSDKELQVTCWDRHLNKVFKKLAKSTQALDGHFLTHWEDGELTIRLYQHIFNPSSQFTEAIVVNPRGTKAVLGATRTNRTGKRIKAK